MALLLSAPQCFILAIAAFGLVGFIRGWRREVISLAFSLAGVLFLLLQGGKGLADLIFVRMPVIFQEIFTANPGTTVSRPPSPNDFTVLITTLVTFAIIVALGYIVGNLAFPAKDSSGTPADRILGIIPGLVTGYFVITYLTNIFQKSPVITVGVNTPTQNLLSDSVPLLFVIALAAVILGLIAARTRKSGGAKK
jgi:uncharacterized membrane protein required for colicin V production